MEAAGGGWTAPFPCCCLERNGRPRAGPWPGDKTTRGTKPRGGQNAARSRRAKVAYADKIITLSVLSFQHV